MKVSRVAGEAQEQAADLGFAVDIENLRNKFLCSGHCWMNIHIVYKHNEGNHGCNICGKMFINPSNLKKHMECVHEGRKDHKCSE